MPLRPQPAILVAMRRQRHSVGNNQEKLQQAESDANPDLSIFDRIRMARARMAPPPKPPPQQAAAPQAAAPQADAPQDEAPKNGFMDGWEEDVERDFGGSNPPRERGLNGAERAAAQEVFGASLDMDSIAIKPGSFGAMDGISRTIGNSINVPIDRFDVFDSEGHRTDSLENYMPTLIHELTHVWQYQNVGPGYMAWGPLSQLYAKITTGDSANAYNQWRANVDAGMEWRLMNVEAQGDLVEGYFSLLKVQKEEIRTLGQASKETTENLAKLQPYIDLLRAGKLEWEQDFNRGSNGEDLDTPMWDI